MGTSSKSVEYRFAINCPANDGHGLDSQDIERFWTEGLKYSSPLASDFQLTIRFPL